MKPPKCRLCGLTHWGGCAPTKKAAPEKPAAKPILKSAAPKFDRKAYQREYMREYMRKRRAKK